MIKKGVKIETLHWREFKYAHTLIENYGMFILKSVVKL